MARKTAQRGPTVPGIIVGAILSITLGVAIAASSLALRPIIEVSQRSKEPLEPGRAYYVKGDTAESHGWAARAALLAKGQPGTYPFVEGDLYSWGRTNLRPTPTPKEGEPTPFVSVTEPFNFRITKDGRLQVATRIELPGILPGRPLVYQSVGTVTNGRFQPAEGFIGQSPVPIVNSMLFHYVTASMEASTMAKDIAKALETSKVTLGSGKAVIVKQ